MIIFDLSCNNEHRFEAWFRSGDDFSEQQARGLISCPCCGSAEVRRMPSPVHLASRGDFSPRPVQKEMAPTPLGALKSVVDRIVASSEFVGEEFAAEARRIHYHAAPERTIHGVTTADEYAALKEEGIDVIPLPCLKPDNLN